MALLSFYKKDHAMLHKTGIILFLFFAPLLMSYAALADGPQDARQVVDGVGKQVLTIVNGGGAEVEKQQQLRQMFTDNVDIDWMAKFVLGRGWQHASEAQRTRYTQSYRQYLLARYTSNFADYAGSNYTITDARSEADGQYTVNMQVSAPRAGQQDTQAGYRLRQANGQFKIVDIIIEGVSLLATQRSEFASVQQQKGMDGLIAAIEAKTQAKGKR